MPGNITSSGNDLFVSGDFTTREMPRLVAAMHNTVAKLGYKDLTLDFSECTSAFPGPMLALVARSQVYWKDGVDIKLSVPKLEQLKRLFLNANWAHLIDPHTYTESKYKGFRQVPAIRYVDGKQQHDSVSKVLDILLSALTEFDRSDLIAIEWALNEITDNVINHSQSAVGGFLQVTNFQTKNRRVEFAVCDAGIGIPASLKPSHPELHTDQEALDRAIREGFTRDTKAGQGNGLYGTWRITELSGGSFEIYSGYASLTCSSLHGLHIRQEQVPFNGTLVVSSINYAQPVDLSKALMFKGRGHIPTDYIELHYQEDDVGNIQFTLAEESSGFGSRAAGDPVRRKLLNLVRVISKGRIVVDFSDVPLISSSYADEIFGKLFVELGPIEFSRHFDFKNVDPLVRQLIDKAITQRATSPH